MVAENRLKGDIDCMIKTITVKLDLDNSIKLICENRTHEIKDNSISSLEIFQILNYSSGDTYEVVFDEQGNKTEIAIPIKEMMERVVVEVNQIELVEDLVTQDIAELEEEEFSE